MHVERALLVVVGLRVFGGGRCLRGPRVLRRRRCRERGDPLLELGVAVHQLEPGARRVREHDDRVRVHLVLCVAHDQLALDVELDRAARHEHATRDEVARQLVLAGEVEHHRRAAHAADGITARS